MNTITNRTEDRTAVLSYLNILVNPLKSWAGGAVGSAPAWHAGGRGFESPPVHHIAGVAQVGERPAEDRKVEGSNPSPGTLGCEAK